MANFIVVDDHSLARLAIRLLLEKEGHIVIAEAEVGDGIASLVNQHRPDGLIMDIDLPGIDGIEAIANLRSSDITIPIIVMSGKNPDVYIRLSKKAGANGFISKQNNLTDLTQAINVVFSGYGYFPFKMYELYHDHIGETDSNLLSQLSKREFEVLRLIGRGKEIIDIATQLDISNKTVSTYKSRLMEKLGLKNQIEMLEFIRRSNIL